MPQETLVPFLAVFAGAGLAFFAIWYFVSSLLRAQRRRMDQRLADDYGEPSLIRESAWGSKPAKDWATRLDTSFEGLVLRSGMDLEPNMALGIILFCGVALGAFVFVWRFENEAWLSIPSFLLGVTLPTLVLIWRQNAWRRTLQRQLPDMLYLLARAARAGRSLDQSFQLVGDQGVQPLAREFARMHRQLELGLSLGQVLQNTSRRLRLVDFNVFASVLGLHRTTGGNLPVILDRLASTTRDRNQFDGQYRAATVLGRYSAAFIAVMVGLILIYQFFFQREWAMRFFETGTGLTLFSTALGLEIMGGLLMYWFLRHDY